MKGGGNDLVITQCARSRALLRGGPGAACASKAIHQPSVSFSNFSISWTFHFILLAFEPILLNPKKIDAPEKDIVCLLTHRCSLTNETTTFHWLVLE